MSKSESCPRCCPFSPEAIQIVRKIQETVDPDERGDLLMRLAQSFDETYEPGDELFSEKFHAVVDNYHQTFLAYQQAALRLGRVLLRSIEEELRGEEDEEGEPVRQTTDQSMN